MSSRGDTEVGRRERGAHRDEKISGQAKEVAKEAGTASMTGSIVQVRFVSQNEIGLVIILCSCWPGTSNMWHKTL